MAEEIQMEEVSKFKSMLLNMRIPSFRGESLKLNEWLAAIQKKKVVFELSGKELVLLAYETVAGAASDFIEKIMGENPGVTWTELRERLEAEYADEPSVLEAMRSLAEIRQKEGETLVELGERINGLSQLAFPQENMRLTPVLQAQWADCYIDALCDEEIKKEILKAEPEDLARAVQLARRNKNFIERIRKRRQGQSKPQRNRERESRPFMRNRQQVSRNR